MITRDELAREMQAFASVLAAARAIIETQGWDEDEEGVLLRALESARAALKAAIRAGEPAPASLDEIWQELIERDDRPSPEKYPYPDMVLITKDELGEFIRSAAPAPAVQWTDEQWARFIVAARYPTVSGADPAFYNQLAPSAQGRWLVVGQAVRVALKAASKGE